jgi:hypothetical protein
MASAPIRGASWPPAHHRSQPQQNSVILLPVILPRVILSPVILSPANLSPAKLSSAKLFPPALSPGKRPDGNSRLWDMHRTPCRAWQDLRGPGREWARGCCSLTALLGSGRWSSWLPFKISNQIWRISPEAAQAVSFGSEFIHQHATGCLRHGVITAGENIHCGVT